jgi:putative membrane protein
MSRPLPALAGHGVAVATALGMIAFPLARPGGELRRHLSGAVVVGLATTTTSATAGRWGWARAALGAAVVGVTTAAVERVGTSTGVPFGRYRYTGRLQPEVAGVPVIVPLAWWSMAVPAREAAHGALGRWSTPARRIALGAVALTAWDLFLDPQMTAEGFWRWSRGGYRGIPWTNYAGWLVTSGAVMAALERLLPPAEPDRALVGEYAVMGVMETVGFAAFFRDRLVAAVGGVAMLPIAAAAVATVVRSGDG